MTLITLGMSVFALASLVFGLLDWALLVLAALLFWLQPIPMFAALAVGFTAWFFARKRR